MSRRRDQRDPRDTFQEIYECVKRHGPVSCKDVVRLTGRSQSNVRYHLASFQFECVDTSLGLYKVVNKETA
jgi:hypothetical protein